ncbi:Sec-independent protein translocase protein TatC [Synergistales bacterium]|nr:Sec-independent protein translocase protein TatC [Synergistales bacterium]GHV55396.1 Sec-independent protein translocase protein TatC [Synergistales bacterium]
MSEGSDWTEHLDELRRRIIAVLVFFCATSLVAFIFSDSIAAFLMRPVAGAVRLYTFSPAEKFMAYLKLAMCSGFAVAAPFAILQAGEFIWPGLIGREKIWAAFALVAVPVLFLGGAAAAYTYLSPAAMKFFLSFASSDGVEPLWGLGAYLDLLTMMMLAFGLLLQAPLLMLILIVTGVISAGRVASARPYVIILIFLAAGICTPPDVFSQIALGVPLYLLFEATLAIGWIVTRKRRTK